VYFDDARGYIANVKAEPPGAAALTASSPASAPPSRQVNRQQQARGFVHVAGLLAANQPWIAEARLVVAVLNVSGLPQPVAAEALRVDAA